MMNRIPSTILKRPATRGFTLVELLVVIAIIVLLAGLLLPGLSTVKRAVKVRMARVDMANLITGITQYDSEYHRMPMSLPAWDSLTDSCPDFTFGTVRPDNTLLAPGYRRIISTGNDGTHQNCNAELMVILRDIDVGANTTHARNPRRKVFYSPKEAVNSSSAGIGADHILRDPWGNPYIVTVDANADGKCQDGFYYPLTKKALKPLLIQAPAAVWSFGPDGAIDPNPAVGPKNGANKDNILSWD